MQSIYNNKVIRNFLYLVIGLFLSEIILKLVMNTPILDWSILRIFLGIVIISSIISLILSFTKRKVSNIILAIILLSLNILYVTQAGFYNYFGTYMSFGSLTQVQAADGFVGDFINSLKISYYFLLIPSILFIIYLIFIERRLDKKYSILKDLIIDSNKKINKKERLKRKENLRRYKKNIKITRISFIGGILLSSILYVSTLYIPFMQNKLQIVANKELFNYPSLPNIAVSQFGILGYEIVDIKSLIFESSSVEREFTKKEEEITDYSRVIDDTAWISLNEEEDNKDYRLLNNYYLSKSITPKNEYTGLLEGKNLIVIMIESGSNVLLNYPEYFPNIAKLYNEGWAWDNAFSPRNTCATGNNEMSTLTSLYSINNSCTANLYKDNTYYNALFNLFNYKGYNTSSYHDYTEYYYYRSIIHPNMGSGKYYNVYDLGIKLGTENKPWPNDVELIEKAVPHFINEDKFMVWMTTVSSHMSYNISSVTGDLYLDLFKDENWSTPIKRYMSKLKIVDNAIGELISELEAAGKLDDTVITLFADHYPYAFGADEFQEIAKYDVSGNGDVDRTPFIIYNPSLTPTKFDEYTSYINILPTLANLFNLDYDPRLYAGHDLLDSDYPNIVIFADGSWRSDIAYYDASTSKINYLGTKKYTDEEIMAINTKVKDDIDMSNLAIKKNYMEYLSKIKTPKSVVEEEQTIDNNEEER